MKKLHIALTLGSLLVGTAALAQTVKVNWQIDSPFADYRTYAWQESKNEGGDFTISGLKKMSTPRFPRKAFAERPGAKIPTCTSITT